MKEINVPNNFLREKGSGSKNRSPEKGMTNNVTKRGVDLISRVKGLAVHVDLN
jgi:hypothetical protein